MTSVDPAETLARRIPAVALVLLLCAFFAGCSSGPRIVSIKSELPPSQSFVVLPPGGPAIISVLEKRYKDAIVRETILSNNSKVSGQNFIMVTLRGPTGYHTVDDNALGPERIGPEQIAQEFQWYLLGVPMQRSALYAQNNYGPFGFATGIAKTGDRCLYAWQHIARHQDQIIPKSGGVSIRLRLCSARATEQQLLSIMYGFTIVGYFESPLWNPYGRPPEVSKDLGGLSAPYEPLLPVTERPRAPRPAAPAPVAPRPLPPVQGPLVPLPEPGEPGGYDGGYVNVPDPTG